MASLPERIEKLESEREKLFTLMSDAEFFKKTPAEMSEAKTRLNTIEEELVSAYKRWEYLEELRERVLYPPLQGEGQGGDGLTRAFSDEPS